MKYRYCTKQEGIDFQVTATATHEGHKIAITEEIKASSYEEAGEYMEEYLDEHHEGFDFEIEILTKEEVEYQKKHPTPSNLVA